MTFVIRGKEARRVAKMLKIKIPRKAGKKAKAPKKTKKEWTPSPLDEAMADDLRKKFGIE